MVYDPKKRHEKYLKNKEKYSQRVKDYYEKNKDHILSKEREYRRNPEIKKRKKKQMKDWYSKNKEHHLKKMKEYNKKPEVMEKLIVRWKTYNLFKNQLGNKCFKCGSTENLEIHHSNYKDLTIENCTLLCRKCHRRLHANDKT